VWTGSCGWRFSVRPAAAGDRRRFGPEDGRVCRPAGRRYERARRPVPSRLIEIARRPTPEPAAIRHVTSPPGDHPRIDRLVGRRSRDRLHRPRTARCARPPCVHGLNSWETSDSWTSQRAPTSPGVFGGSSSCSTIT
jgi:hypothetical protein